MTAVQLQQVLLLLAVGLAGLVGLAVFVPRPRWTLALFGIGIAAVPIWVGGNVLPFVTPHIALGALCVVSLALAPAGEHSPRVGLLSRIRAFDVVLLVLFALAVGSWLLRVVSFGQVYLVATWGLMYLAGRLAGIKVGLRATATMLAVIFTVIAVLAVAEFATGRNLWLEFTGNGTSAFAVWGPQQYRGSYVRAEGAFGHSIALGASLAIAMVLTFASRLRTGAKLAAVGVMAVALVLTFSRIGLVTAAIGIALVILRSPSMSLRLRAILLGLAGVAVPVVLLVASDAFAEDSGGYTDSALYRLWLWDVIPELKPVGQSDLVVQTTDGTSTVGSFGSIDSAVILHAVSNGWVPALILCVAFTIAALRLLLRGGDEALATVVALIPAFFTVALITQYAHLVWFVVGLAVSGLGVAPTAGAKATPGLAARERPESLARVG
ncbi:MAG: hypothetical protein LCH87_13710 [Actinobacteria bacterium]|nr:hypothetical protein [Actinomycetota bacterium]